MSSTPDKLWMMYDYYVDELKVLTESAPEVKKAFPQLSSVKSCALVGAGYGNRQLAFIDGCMPNITEMVAVEPFDEHMEELKIRVARQLPNVKVDYYMETVENYQNTNKPYEVALMFESVHDVPQAERQAMFKKLFYNVVASGGLVFFLVYPYTASNPQGGFGRLISHLGSVPMEDVDLAVIREQMKSAGFTQCYELPLYCQLMMGDRDDKFLSTIEYWSEGTVSKERVRELAQEVFGDKKIDPFNLYLLGFKKR